MLTEETVVVLQVESIEQRGQRKPLKRRISSYILKPGLKNWVRDLTLQHKNNRRACTSDASTFELDIENILYCVASVVPAEDFTVDSASARSRLR